MAPGKKPIIEVRIEKLTDELKAARKKWRDVMKKTTKEANAWKKKLETQAKRWKLKLDKAEHTAYQKALAVLEKKEATKKKTLLSAEMKFEKEFAKKQQKPRKKRTTAKKK